jgi:hypothetical protein
MTTSREVSSSKHEIETLKNAAASRHRVPRLHVSAATEVTT